MASRLAQSPEQSRLHLVPGAGVDGRRPRVVIVGAGFAGLTVAKRLAKAPADIILIDKENYHLFQPLLYQVATAGLSPADIAWPIRSLVRDQRNTRVLLGEVTGVDHVRKRVNMGDRNIAYDVLVLATGATHGYFGNDSWAAHAPGLKTIDDATEIRRRLLLAFERAEMESDARQLERLLTIVIVGGGPTGVEMAGAVVELARKVLATDFRANRGHAGRRGRVRGHDDLGGRGRRLAGCRLARGGGRSRWPCVGRTRFAATWPGRRFHHRRHRARP